MKTFKIHRFKDNPQEKVFVDEFMKDFSKNETPDLIVFSHQSNSSVPKDFLSEREKDIVISTIQWLGSPVGQGFLGRCGFVPKENPKKKNNRNEITDDDLDPNQPWNFRV